MQRNTFSASLEQVISTRSEGLIFGEYWTCISATLSDSISILDIVIARGLRALSGHLPRLLRATTNCNWSHVSIYINVDWSMEECLTNQ